MMEVLIGTLNAADVFLNLFPDLWLDIQSSGNDRSSCTIQQDMDIYTEIKNLKSRICNRTLIFLSASITALCRKHNREAAATPKVTLLVFIFKIFVITSSRLKRQYDRNSIILTYCPWSIQQQIYYCQYCTPCCCDQPKATGRHRCFSKNFLFKASIMHERTP